MEYHYSQFSTCINIVLAQMLQNKSYFGVSVVVYIVTLVYPKYSGFESHAHTRPKLRLNLINWTDLEKDPI